MLTSKGTEVAQADPDPGWYNASWLYRKKITIDHNLVDANLTNFPVLINRTDTDFTKARTDGFDFVFTEDDGVTELKYEREKWDDGTGELIAWVKVPNVSSTVDTDIYIYYGNAAQGTDKADPENVWDSSFKMVQHLQEDPTDPDPAFKDSTSNDNDGSNWGSMDSSDQVIGQVDGSIDFDGIDDRINIGNLGNPRCDWVGNPMGIFEEA